MNAAKYIGEKARMNISRPRRNKKARDANRKRKLAISMAAMPMTCMMNILILISALLLPLNCPILPWRAVMLNAERKISDIPPS